MPEDDQHKLDIHREDPIHGSHPESDSALLSAMSEEVVIEPEIVEEKFVAPTPAHFRQSLDVARDPLEWSPERLGFGTELDQSPTPKAWYLNWRQLPTRIGIRIKYNIL